MVTVGNEAENLNKALLWCTCVFILLFECLSDAVEFSRSLRNHCFVSVFHMLSAVCKKKHAIRAALPYICLLLEREKI